jgi:hypothetical protein
MAARGAGAFPIAAICCLALILLAIASTIVLALIPVYLARRDIAVGAINSMQHIFESKKSSITYHFRSANYGRLLSTTIK